MVNILLSIHPYPFLDQGVVCVPFYGVKLNSLSPGGCNFDFKCVIFKCVVVITFIKKSSAIAFSE